MFAFAASLAILRTELQELGLWDDWYPAYRRLLRDARVMMTIQVLLQRNRIPFRSRGPLLARFGRTSPSPRRTPSRCRDCHCWQDRW